MIVRSLILFFIATSAIGVADAQISVKDSVGKILGLSQPDTTKIIALDDYAWNLLYSRPDSALYVTKVAMDLAKELSFSEKKAAVSLSENYTASILVTLGSVYYLRSDYNSALHQFHKAMKIREQQNNETAIANILNNIGLVLVAEGDYSKALDCYYRGYDIKERSKDLKGQAYFLNNIGNIYENLNDPENAMKYFRQSLAINKKLDDKSGVAATYTNLGLIYRKFKDTDSAIYCFQKSIDLFRQLNDGFGLSKAYTNMGHTLEDIGKIEGAYNYYSQALVLKENLSDVAGMSAALSSVGNILLHQKRYEEAISHCREAFELAHLTRTLQNKRDACKCLASAYESVGKDKLALLYFRRFAKYKDSLNATDKTQEIIRKEMEYRLEKARMADSLDRAAFEKRSEVERIRTQLAHEKNMNIQRLVLSLVGSVLLVVGVFSFFLYRRYKITEQQKKTIEEQKKLVEEKNKDITDSIRYAQHIQTAILPPGSRIKECLPESFVLYRPRDIVSGDFYWVEKVGDRTLLAVVDCTGHGVPGALVSIVGSNGLNRTVNEYGLMKPNSILDKLDQLVNESFRQKNTDEFIRDGMDIALCSVRPAGEKFKIEYAGANNPLWVFRKNPKNTSEPYSFMEVKPDKQPIGQYTPDDPNTPFSLSELTLEKGDTFYIFSDGYTDQFGGPEGKKFKHAQLRKLLLDTQSIPLTKQHDLLNRKFDEWKGELEQVDDVCIIGVRL